jgi:hypothetical protein
MCHCICQARVREVRIYLIYCIVYRGIAGWHTKVLFWKDQKNDDMLARVEDDGWSGAFQSKTLASPCLA